MVLVVGFSVSLLLAEGLVRLADRAGIIDLSPTLADVPLPAEFESEVDFDLANAERPLYVGDPVLHHTMTPNWTGYFPEEMMSQVGRSEVPIRTNNLGVRGPQPLQPKPDDVFRIVVLGDSVTFGWGVREEDTYAHQLATLLAALQPGQRFEIINAGVSGYGTWQQSLWLEQRLEELSPDLVVVQLHLNDAADNLWGTYGQDVGGSSWLARNSALAKLIRLQVISRQGSGSGNSACERDWHQDFERICWDKTQALLLDIRANAARKGAPLALLAVPMRWQIEPGIRDPRAWVDTEQYQEPLADFSRRNRLIFVDPLPAFRETTNASGHSLFLDAGHPNEAGNRILAQDLYTALTGAGALP